MVARVSEKALGQLLSYVAFIDHQLIPYLPFLWLLPSLHMVQYANCRWLKKDTTESSRPSLCGIPRGNLAALRSSHQTPRLLVSPSFLLSCMHVSSRN